MHSEPWLPAVAGVVGSATPAVRQRPPPQLAVVLAFEPPLFAVAPVLPLVAAAGGLLAAPAAADGGLLAGEAVPLAVVAVAEAATALPVLVLVVRVEAGVLL